MERSSRRTATRIGHDARAAATGTLDIALREGRIDLAEYERRLVVVQAAKVDGDLTPVITDLPSRPAQRGPGLRISSVDREEALVRLAEALTDGRIEATEYADTEELLRRAVTYADVDAVVGDLDARASLAERQQAIERIEAAVAEGLLDPAEQHGRVEAVRHATTDAQLAALVADLTTNTRSPAAPARASNVDRDAAARLHDAVEAGFLDLTEFDERVRAVYAARLSSELTSLVADLPDPARTPAPLPQPPPAGTPRREWKMPRHEWIPGTGYILTLYNLVGGLLFGGITYGMAVSGLGGWAMSPGVVWLIILVLIVRHGRRPVEKLPGLAGHQRLISTVTGLVLPDGTPVVISGGQDNTAMVWDLATHSPRHTLSGHTNDVLGVAAMVLPDGAPVAVTISADRTAVVWDLRDGAQRGTLPGTTGEPRSVLCCTLPDGTPTAILLSSDAIRLWDLRDLSELHAFGADSTIEAIAPMALPGDDPVLVVMPSNDTVVNVVSIEDGQRKFDLPGHTDTITAIDTTVLPDGTPVAVSASLDKTVRVWDLRQGTLLHTITGMIFAPQHVICSSLPDGTPIVVTAVIEDDTRVWDLRDGAELRGIGLRGGPITGVAVPDRTLVVGTGYADATVVEVYPLSFR